LKINILIKRLILIVKKKKKKQKTKNKKKKKKKKKKKIFYFIKINFLKKKINLFFYNYKKKRIEFVTIL